MLRKLTAAVVLCAALLLAMARVSFQAQSASTIAYTVKGDEQNIAIHNVNWLYANTRLPGHDKEDWLVFRTTIEEKNFIGDIPEPGTLAIEAWMLGTDPKQKPLYTVNTGGVEAKILENSIWVIDRGYVESPLWLIHRVADGKHLFDTHVPLVKFTVSREDGTPRYAGLDVPGDDVKDARLKDAHVVAMLEYAGEDKVLREVLITHDKPAEARQLRSLADEEQQLAFVETPARRLKISWSHIYPDAPHTVEMSIPVGKDDVDLAHAQIPAGMHAVAWKR